MSASEFSLIERFFAHLPLSGRGVVVGIGDDAAILSVGSSRRTATTVETLGTGGSSCAGVDAKNLAERLLDAPCSRLAAANAIPAWATLALTIPDSDEGWLATFSNEFAAAAERWNVALVGGDLTRGPLRATAAVIGLPDAGACAERRAKPVGRFSPVDPTIHF